MTCRKLTYSLPKFYSLRNDDQYKRIAEICSEIVDEVPGNSVIFFPSYFLRDKVNQFFECKKTLFLEQSEMSKEEKTILDSVEIGEWKSVRGAKGKIIKYQEYAKATFRKDKRINIRISENDLVGIPKKAVEEGLPYQTLISSVLHKFISGRLVEKKS